MGAKGSLVVPVSRWPCLVRASSLDAALSRADQWAAAGVTGVLAPAPWRRPPGSNSLAPLDADRSEHDDGALEEHISRAAIRLADSGLSCHLEITLDRVARGAVPGTVRPEWLRRESRDPVTDPRVRRCELFTQPLVDAPPHDDFVASWVRRLSGWVDCGVAGFCCHSPQNPAPPVWRSLIDGLNATNAGLRFIAWTPGLTSDELSRCRAMGFNWTVSSLAWWDGRADWLAEENVRLRDIAPAMAYVGRRQALRWLAAAAVGGDGVILESPSDADIDGLRSLVEWRRAMDLVGPLTTVGGRGGRASAMSRASATGASVVLALSGEGDSSARIDCAELAALLPAGVRDAQGVPAALRPREDKVGVDGCALLQWRETHAVGAPVAIVPPGPPRRRYRVPRISIEDIRPLVDAGVWPIKRVTHEALTVTATIFTDGRDKLAADLLWRACDEANWHRVCMEALENDRWRAQCAPERIGNHEYCIVAWIDTWAGLCTDWHAKFEAGVDCRADLREGAQWLERAIESAEGSKPIPLHRAEVRDAAVALESACRTGLDGDLLKQLLSSKLANVLRSMGGRPFACATAALSLRVDPPRAGYGSWYELFPRSQSSVPTQYGTLNDVIMRLPDIRQMGFDVLYLTPIHPIGRENRKGRNNSLAASAEDVGSPYAIGAPEGGHDAVHSQLGALADFDLLVLAARGEGLEIALDFAIQCSPDHPWLSQHPEWFSWRPDGSLRHAENPPKKYEDIVNVSFYDGAHPGRRKMALWRALRDVALFWVEHGVKIFRVDNPHTKPLPFWHWLILEVRQRAPEVIFLSEAFTRPAMMAQLAKIGFTQSYTYFTWRNEPREIDAYLRELSQPPAAEYFRPMFFTNTPDINPTYLQEHGRPGFLVRAALAATGAGLWGVYSGFELCEAAALPGREEYADSEKYELRQRDWHAAGNIRDEISRLNAIRRANPALQSHRGYRGVSCEPGCVLAYLRHSASLSNVLLILINLDPANAVEARVRLAGIRTAENLLTGGRESWPDEFARAWLHPDAPYGIWRLPEFPGMSLE